MGIMGFGDVLFISLYAAERPLLAKRNSCSGRKILFEFLTTDWVELGGNWNKERMDQKKKKQNDVPKDKK